MQEYWEAKELLKRMEKSPRAKKLKLAVHRSEFKKYVEALITVKGQAWCMDVESERKKMVRLLVKAVEGFIV